MALLTRALLGAALLGAAPVEPASEAEVKAVYLFQFTKFVEWPAGAFAGPRSPLTLCLLGAEPMGGVLERAVERETFAGRPYAVRRLEAGEDPRSCHVLFLAGPERGRLARVLERLSGSATLTVGEAPGFAERGGMIGFVREGDKVRFEIDQAAAEAAGLKVSARLLSLGRRRKG